MAGTTLVTGATGFIGSHVARQLVERGERVRVLVRTPAKLREVGLEGLAGLEVVRGDLLEPQTLPAALDGVARIHHIAGYIATARAERDRVHRLNVDITRNLFEAAERAGVERIVYLASIFALGGGTREPSPVDEQVVYELDGFGVDYFEAKRRAELYARERCAAGLPIVFVYPCFCYGPGDVYGSSSLLVEMHLRRLLVTSLPGGQNAMDVRDAAAGLIRGMERGRVGERYLIGGENRTNAELGELLAAITGYPRPRLVMPRVVVEGLGKLAERISKRAPLDEQAARIACRYWYYDDGKARRELGHTSRPLTETLLDAIEWFCDTGRARRPPRLR